MPQLVALFAAGMVLATSVASSTIQGAFALLTVTAAGASVTIRAPGGRNATIPLARNATVRERASGEAWHSVSVTALKAGEHVTITVDVAGAATEIDAEYAAVFTRAVAVENGYFVGTDGVVRKLEPGAPASISLGTYVRLRTDPASGDIFDADVSTHPFAGAPSKTVAVTFEVRVPVNTPPSSTVYLATNAQNWTANAIRLSPELGNRWTATVSLPAGTLLQYKYTRGSWATGERNASGAEIANRTLTVASGLTQSVHDVVARWADLPS